MNLTGIFLESIRDIIGVADVKAVIDSGGVVFAYPRKKQVRLNGGRAKPATDAAVKLAHQWAKAKTAELNQSNR